jgi:hypothetical protein
VLDASWSVRTQLNVDAGSERRGRETIPLLLRLAAAGPATRDHVCTRTRRNGQSRPRWRARVDFFFLSFWLVKYTKKIVYLFLLYLVFLLNLFVERTLFIKLLSCVYKMIYVCSRRCRDWNRRNHLNFFPLASSTCGMVALRHVFRHHGPDRRANLTAAFIFQKN